MQVATGRFRQRWLDLSMRRKGWLVLSPILAALMAVASVSLWLQLHEHQVRDTARQANALSSAAQSSLVVALDAETGIRGYAATGDPKFLAPYIGAVRDLPKALTALDQAASDRNKRGAGADIHSAVRAEFTLLSQLRDDVSRGARGATLQAELAGGKTMMDRLRARVAGVLAGESTFAADQRGRIDTTENQVLVVAAAGLGLGLLGGIAGVGLFSSGITRRVSAAVANAERLGHGQPLEPRPAAHDELGQLAVALAEAEALLVQNAADLVQVRDEARRASQAKTVFLSRTSHELRTPLNAVLGFAQLLQLADMVGVDRDNVEQILNAGRHLVAMINDVLDIARIEAGEMTLSLEPVSLSRASTETAALLQPLARARAITINQECSSPALAANADRQRLNQILLNLLSNAVKYNHDGGHVSLGCADADPGYVELTVTDTGPGLTEAQLQRLFTPFERLGAEQGGVEGTGLGLTVTKALAEAMGGQLLVTSAPGLGATFTVRLRRAPDIASTAAPTPIGTPATAPATAADTAPAAGIRLLYVEDNVANILVIERLLTNRAGIILDVATSGERGLDLARQRRPSIILLDLHLPDISGEVVLHRLHADPLTADIPVVVLSADATPSSIRRLIDAGAANYLTKPIDLRQLLAVLGDTDNRAADNLAPAVHPAPHATTVLYIEDDKQTTTLVERLLQQRPGLKLVVAHRGHEGIQLAQEHHPNLVLLDRHLPDMTGDDILARLKAAADTAEIPVIMLSGDTGAGMAQSLENGVVDYLMKPFHLDDFLAAVDRWTQ